SRVSIADGRKRVVRGFRQDRRNWEILIIDHHDGYLSWAEFERNQRLIADNATSKGMMARGAIRRGETLLAGLLRCGHCGRKLHVAYGGTSGEAGRYHCKDLEPAGANAGGLEHRRALRRQSDLGDQRPGAATFYADGRAGNRCGL